MRASLIALASVIATALAGSASAATDWFPGQTGQYHLIPDGTDVQKLTLLGFVDPSCGPSGVALYSVDEYGQRDNVPFVVPSKTVFLLTDAIFTGNASLPFPGRTPWLNIANHNVAVASPKASFLANRPLVGNSGEYFSGEGSLASGAAFAVNSKLCAYLDFSASTYNGSPPNGDLYLYNVVVHGTLVDDTHTAFPYFAW